jgi:tRNA(Ile)-lysidine synthetase-like protein
LDIDPIVVWRWISTIFLAAVLFRPAKKFILAQKLNKAERKLKRAMTEEEIKEVERRTIPVIAIIVITFSMFFNNVIMNKFYK